MVADELVADDEPLAEDELLADDDPLAEDELLAELLSEADELADAEPPSPPCVTTPAVATGLLMEVRVSSLGPVLMSTSCNGAEAPFW